MEMTYTHNVPTQIMHFCTKLTLTRQQNIGFKASSLRSQYVHPGVDLNNVVGNFMFGAFSHQPGLAATTTIRSCNKSQTP